MICLVAARHLGKKSVLLRTDGVIKSIWSVNLNEVNTDCYLYPCCKEVFVRQHKELGNGLLSYRV